MTKFRTKGCPNCLATLTEIEMIHKYQGQEYTTVEFPKHDLSDCIGYLRKLIDGIDRNQRFHSGKIG